MFFSIISRFVLFLLAIFLYISNNNFLSKLISKVNIIPAVRQRYNSYINTDCESFDVSNSTLTHSPLKDFGRYDRNRISIDSILFINNYI